MPSSRPHTFPQPPYHQQHNKMAEAHLTEIENVIEFYKAHETTAGKLLSLETDKFGADNHLLSLAFLASIDRHPGAAPGFALADTLNSEGWKN